MYECIIKFKTGAKVYTTELSSYREICRRLDRLDVLRVLTEAYEEGEGASICKKAWKAWNKTKGFTGIIRLTPLEKDWLSYMRYENSYLTDEDIKVLDFYLK